MNTELDTVKYEIFVRRLSTVLEEGRKAISMVSGSPAIVEGGEVMTSFYDGDGKGILTAAGTLFHVVGAADAVRYALNEYEENPGISDGDQFYFADPYIAGTHLMDQILIKPIFYQGKRVAWVATMTHTGDIGGLLRGASTEIYHEGIRFRGIKIFEDGKTRKDILDSITSQCRDPDYVAIDILARAASNNVCGEGFIRLVEKFGVEFVQAASRKLREDAESVVRDKLRGLPDGTYRQRVYVSTSRKNEKGQEEPVPLKVQCAMTKDGDSLSFDLSGTSPQNADYRNATLASARSSLFAPLCTFIFYDVPWNPEMISWVDIKIPEGSFLNCRYPASCGLGTECGLVLMSVIAGCITKMLYVAGLHDYVNAGWSSRGLCAAGYGPGVWYGGHNQKGGIVGQGTYDLFAGAGGGAPSRDGVNTSGIYCNPTSCISDAEFTEMYWPLLFLARKHARDSGGCGKYRGGQTLETIALVYGSEDLTADFLAGPQGGEIRGYGLHGGYPGGNCLGDSRLILTSKNEIVKRFSEGLYPVDGDELEHWGKDAVRSDKFRLDRQMGGVRVNLPEYGILDYVYGTSGGYGDPLDREPGKVADDLQNDAVSLEIAEKVYGVIFTPGTIEIDEQKTTETRTRIREERLRMGKSLMPENELKKNRIPSGAKNLVRISEYLDICELPDGEKVISCRRCSQILCAAGENYKRHCLRILRGLRDIKKVSENVEPLTSYHEYICPDCATLLQVDTWCPSIDSDEPLWDIDVKV